MLVTVAICTWNRAGVLDKTLHRMRSLRLPAGADWELLVVNNNCTDQTDAVADSHAGHLPVRRLFEPRPGISYARNCAIKHARGDYLLWIDDDAWPDPDWIERMLEAFDTFGADLVIGKVVPEWVAGKPPQWYTPESRGLFALLDYGPEPCLVTDPHIVGFNVNLGIRQSSFAVLGAYRTADHGRVGGGEDIDLFRRAYAAGLTVVYQPFARVRHVIPVNRCEKAFHRQAVRAGTAYHLALLRAEADQSRLPTWLGIPRYFYRYNAGYLVRYLKALLTRDRGRAFFYELKMIRLAALIRLSLAERRRGQPSAIPEASIAP